MNSEPPADAAPEVGEKYEIAHSAKVCGWAKETGSEEIAEIAARPSVD
jgi:ferritin-like metal-binding protein YciE